jgi:hypothetical protein
VSGKQHGAVWWPALLPRPSEPARGERALGGLAGQFQGTGVGAGGSGDPLAKARNIRLAGFESLAVYAALRAARARAPAGAAVAAVGLTVHGAPSLWTKRWRAWW